jgi:hypothetical protein
MEADDPGSRYLRQDLDCVAERARSAAAVAYNLAHVRIVGTSVAGIVPEDTP